MIKVDVLPGPASKRKRGATKRPRDKNAPSKPLSAYHFFFRNRHSAIPRAERSGQSVDINRRIASEWNTISEEKKKEFVVLADEDRSRYVKEFEQYKKTDSYKNFQKVLRK